MTHVLLLDPLEVREGGFNHQAGAFPSGLSTSLGLEEKITSSFIPLVILSPFFGLTVPHTVTSLQKL